jgi:hypothetical protein
VLASGLRTAHDASLRMEGCSVMFRDADKFITLLAKAKPGKQSR